MLILGIETSCDDTAASVVEDGRAVLSSVVCSQDSLHANYGGIVPELASRRHIEAIIPTVEEALKSAGAGIEAMDGVAVSIGPGLVGSILVGLSFAKAVSYVRGIPFVGVNHIMAHTMAAFLFDSGAPEGGAGGAGDAPEFPFVSLVVSGGHTTLFHVKDFTSHEVIGETVDDAAGEAFDKVAKLLGLGYPGGAAIDRLSVDGDPGHIRFKRPLLEKDSLDFSFSGIKTAVLNHMHHMQKTGAVLRPDEIQDLSASFQEAVVDALVEKAARALNKTHSSRLVVAGGVACNSRLREKLKDRCQREGWRLYMPRPNLCTDNGAMVAGLGYYLLKSGKRSGLDMNADPGLGGG